MRRNFQYIDTIRRPDGRLRTWNEYDLLSRHEWNCERDYNAAPLISAITMKDLERDEKNLQALDNDRAYRIKKAEEGRNPYQGYMLSDKQNFLECSQETEGVRYRAPHKEKI